MSSKTLVQLATGGSLKAIREAIAKGAELDKIGKKGESALMIAAWNGRDDVCAALVEAGADVNLRTERGRTALDNASYRQRESTCDLLIRAGASMARAFNIAASLGRLDQCTLILSHGHDVNAINEDSLTALMFAADNNQAGAIEYLVARSANVNQQDKYGMSALHRAAMNAQYDACKALLAAQASVDATTHKGETPLMHAVRPGASSVRHGPVIALLLDHGANFDHRCHQGQSVMDKANGEFADASVADTGILALLRAWRVSQAARLAIEEISQSTPLMAPR